jgi:hypothetical protein
MHSILVALKAPDAKNALLVNEWNAAIDSIRNAVPKTTKVEELAEGIFLIRDSSGLPILGGAIAFAARRRIAYRVIFIESGTEWRHDAPK